MTRGGAGNMLGVGGARRNLGREALRGGNANGRIGGGPAPQAQKRELLRKLQEKRQETETETKGETKGETEGETEAETETGGETRTGTGTEGTTGETA